MASLFYLHDGWSLAFFEPSEIDSIHLPEGEWRAANVPGTVQTSPFGLPTRELYQGLKVGEVQWMEKKAWVYRRTVGVPVAAADETVRLVFEGLDYYYEIWLDGHRVIAGEGMFHPVPVELDAWQGRNVEVEVRFRPPPATREALWETTKAQFGRGWDFAPELRTIGIWDEVRLEVAPRLRVVHAFLETRLENTQRARVTLRAELSGQAEGWARVSLAGSTRRVPLLGADRFTAFIEIDTPELWWPNGLGAAALHDLEIALEVEGRSTAPFTQRVGLREVSRLPAEGQRAGDIPLQLAINGVPFFIQGMNWVPPDSCVGEIRDSHYDGLLGAFAVGHVNLVRVWGGGLCEKRRFYEKCDELGLLVFQEYPIACGLGTTTAYHRQLQAEARQIARKLAKHPSVFLYSGGNENYHYWHMLQGDAPELKDAAAKALIAVNDGKPFDNPEWLAGAVKKYDEPVHLLLGGVTAEEAPHCLYQNTSAMEGEGEVHGTWTWNPRIGDHRYRMYETIYEYWRAADQHLYSESSVSSIANLETIADVTGVREGEAMPEADDPVWRLHHAFHGVWDKARDLWLDLPSTEKVFGPIKPLKELVVLNQYLQAEGGRFMIEEMRRKQPHVTGLIWWGVNEPWPGLAGNALIDYFGRPKLAWQFITNAFSPVIVSLRYDALQPEVLSSEVWLSCNARTGFEGRYEVRAVAGDGTVLFEAAGDCAAKYRESQVLETMAPLDVKAAGNVEVKTVLWDGAGRVVHENSYLFGEIRAAVLGRFGVA